MQGVSEVIRGNINVAIDALCGDQKGKELDEEVIRQGQREFTTKSFDK